MFMQSKIIHVVSNSKLQDLDQGDSKVGIKHCHGFKPCKVNALKLYSVRCQSFFAFPNFACSNFFIQKCISTFVHFMFMQSRNGINLSEQIRYFQVKTLLYILLEYM